MQYGALATAGLIAGLILAELCVRVFVPRERFSIVVSDVYRRSPDPEVGYTLRPGFDGYAFGVPLATNRYGYRGPDWPKERSPGVFRIALIGDSHAFGVGVEYERTMGQRLAGYLAQATGRRVETLNFAVSGYNTRQQLEVFRSLALGFDPSLVIVVPCNNDAEPALSVDDEGHLRWRAADVVVSHERRPFGTWAAMTARSILIRSKLFLLTKMTLLERGWGGGAASQPSLSDDPTWMEEPVPDIPVPDALVRLVMNPLREILSESTARGLSVILAPFAAPAEYRRMFLNLAIEQNVPFVELLGRDVFPEIRGWGQIQEAFGLGWDSHLNAAAHDRWARILARTVIEQGLVPTDATRRDPTGSRD